MRHRRESSSAFTLIELLTVIAIVGILAAILVPVVQAARQRALSAVGASNLRVMGQGVLAYANDQRGQMPPVYYTGTSFTTFWVRHNNLYRNLGLLWEGGYVTAAETFFTPARQAGVDRMTYNGPDNAWDSVQVRGSFLARMLTVNGVPAPSFTPNAWRLSDYTSKVIYSDFMPTVNANVGPVNGGRGFFRLYGGGAVRWTQGGTLTRTPTSATPSAAELAAMFEELDTL